MSEPCAWRIERPDDPEDWRRMEVTAELLDAVTREPLLQPFSLQVFITPFRISDN